MSDSKIDKKEYPSLIPLDDFKSVLGIDDREEKTARFCLVTATRTIEQYCKRRLLRKKHFEHIEFSGDLLLPLREYPVVSINKEQLEISNGKIVEREFYHVIPDCGTDMDIPFSIELSPVFLRYPNLKSIKVVYTAGYEQSKIPADLSAACLELAAWNFNRYKGRRIGMSGNIRGAGIRGNHADGEHFELSMPENVRSLIEPYKRRTI